MQKSNRITPITRFPDIITPHPTNFLAAELSSAAKKKKKKDYKIIFTGINIQVLNKVQWKAL